RAGTPLIPLRRLPVLANLIRTLSGRLKGPFQKPARSGNLLLWLLRGCFGATVIGLATAALYYFDRQGQFDFAWVAFGAIMATGILVVSVDLLVRNKQITTISAVYFGLLMGFLLGNFFWSALEPLVVESLRASSELVQPLRLFITLVCCYV